MSTTWYYRVGDREIGPVTAAELRHKAMQSEIRPETFVRQGTEGRWVRADLVQGLLPPSTPAPPPVARSVPAPPPLPSSPMPAWVTPVAAVGLVLLGMALGLVVVRWSHRGEVNTPVAVSPERPEPVAPERVAPKPVEAPPVAEVAPGEEVESVVKPAAKPQAEGPAAVETLTPAEMVEGPVVEKPDVPEPVVEEPVVEEPIVEKPPEPIVEKPPVPEPRAADAGEDDAWRIERFREIYAAVVPLFKKWEDLESEVGPLRAELGPLVALCTQLEQQNMRLQREAQILDNSYRAVRNDPDSADTANDLLIRLTETQRQLTTVAASLGRARSERASLEARIRELTESQLQLVKAADAECQEWISLADPFGKLGRATHERIADLMTGWIAEHPKLAMPYLARGFSLLRLGQTDRALADFEATATYDPRLAALALAARGYAFALQGDARASGVEFGKALKLDPKMGVVRVFRAQAYLDQGKYSQALKELRLALRTGEDVPEVQEATALLLAASPHESVRDGKKAVEHATKACQLIGRENWAYLSTLAAAYAEDGRFDEAVRTAQKALDLAPEESRDELRKRLSLYQAGKPYRLK